MICAQKERNHMKWKGDEISHKGVGQGHPSDIVIIETFWSLSHDAIDV